MFGPWKKAHQVEKLVLEHLTQVGRTIDLFLASARAYVLDEDGDEADRPASGDSPSQRSGGRHLP